MLALDPSNGEVLAFVSKPGFDPNLFVDGIDPANWELLNDSPDDPFNKIIRDDIEAQADHGAIIGYALVPALGQAGKAPKVPTFKYDGAWPKPSAAHSRSAIGTHRATSIACPTTSGGPG